MTRPIEFSLRDLSENQIQGSVVVTAWLVPPAGETRLPLNTDGELVSTAPVSTNQFVESILDPYVWQPVGTTQESVRYRGAQRDTGDTLVSGKTVARLLLIQQQHLPEGWTYNVTVAGTHSNQPIGGTYTRVQIPDYEGMGAAPAMTFGEVLRGFTAGRGPDFVAISQEQLDDLRRGANIGIITDGGPIPAGSGTIEGTGRTSAQALRVRDGSIDEQKLQTLTRDRIAQSVDAREVSVDQNARTIHIESHDGTTDVDIPLPPATPPQTIRDTVAGMTDDNANEVDASLATNASRTKFALIALPRNKPIITHEHLAAEHVAGHLFLPDGSPLINAEAEGRNRDGSPGSTAAQSDTTAESMNAVFELTSNGNAGAFYFTLRDVMSRPPRRVGDNPILTPAIASQILTWDPAGAGSLPHSVYIARTATGQWLLGRDTQGDTDFTIREIGSGLEDFARTSSNERVPAEKIGRGTPTADFVLTQTANGPEWRAVTTDDGGAADEIAPDTADPADATTTQPIGTIKNFSGRLYELLSSGTRNVITRVARADTDADVESGYRGFAEWQFKLAGDEPNPVIGFIPETGIGSVAPSSLIVKVHDIDTGYYGEMQFNRAGAPADRGTAPNREFGYGSTGIGVDTDQVNVGDHVVVTFFDVDGTTARAVVAATKTWTADARRVVGTLPWAQSGNPDTVPIDKLPTRNAAPTTRDPGTTQVPVASAISEWAWTSFLNDPANTIPVEVLGTGGTDSGDPAMGDVLYGNGEWRAAPTGGQLTVARLLGLTGFMPTFPADAGKALAVGASAGTVQLIDISGVSGDVENNPLAANTTVSSPGNWGTWTTLASSSRLTAQNTGYRALFAGIRFRYSGASQGRRQIETRITAQVGTTGEVRILASRLNFASRYGGQPTTLDIAGEELSAVDPGVAQTIYRLQVRSQGQDSSSTTQLSFRAPVTTGTAANRNRGCYLDVAVLGGIQGERGPAGPPGQDGAAGGVTQVTARRGITNAGSAAEPILDVDIPVPSGGSDGQVLKWSGSPGAPGWGTDDDTGISEGAVDGKIATAVAGIRQVPSGGAANQLLQRNASNVLTWINDPGWRTAGQVTAAINAQFTTRLPVKRQVPGTYTQADAGESLLVNAAGTALIVGPPALTQGQVLDAIGRTLRTAAATARSATDRNKVLATGPEDTAGGENTLRLIDAPVTVPGGSAFPVPPNDPKEGDRFELTGTDSDVPDPAGLLVGEQTGDFFGWFGTVGKIEGPFGANATPPRGALASPLPGIDAIYYSVSALSARSQYLRRIVVVRSSSNTNDLTRLFLGTAANEDNLVRHDLTRVAGTHFFITNQFAVGSPPFREGDRIGVNVAYGTSNTLIRPNVDYDAGTYIFDGIRWVEDSASAQTIRDKLESLHGAARLDFSALKNVPVSRFTTRLFEGPAIGLTVTDSDDSVRGALNLFLQPNSTTPALNISDTSNAQNNYVARGELAADITVSIHDKSSTTLGLRHGGQTTNSDVVTVSGIRFLNDLRAGAVFDNSSDRALLDNGTQLARSIDVYDGTARLGRIRVKAYRNAAGDIGYLAFYTGRGSLARRFSVSVSMNVELEPSDADLTPGPADDPVVDIDGPDDEIWCIWPANGMFPTRAYGGAIQSNWYQTRAGAISNYLWGRTARGAAAGVQPPATNWSYIDMPGSPPANTIGLWVISQIAIANDEPATTYGDWEDVHRIFYAYGPTGVELSVDGSGNPVWPTQPARIGSNAMLTISYNASSASQQSSQVGITFSAWSGNGNISLQVSGMHLVPRPPARVLNSGTTLLARATGTSTTGGTTRSARYRIIVKPATISVSNP